LTFFTLSDYHKGTGQQDSFFTEGSHVSSERQRIHPAVDVETAGFPDSHIAVDGSTAARPKAATEHQR
jgi:hypothetical protein